MRSNVDIEEKNAANNIVLVVQRKKRTRRMKKMPFNKQCYLFRVSSATTCMAEKMSQVRESNIHVYIINKKHKKLQRR